MHFSSSTSVPSVAPKKGSSERDLLWKRWTFLKDDLNVSFPIKLESAYRNHKPFDVIVIHN